MVVLEEGFEAGTRSDRRAFHPIEARGPPRRPRVPIRGAIRHDEEIARGLVGRSAELAAIGRALEAVGSGQARAVALVGEPGIGTTRLTIVDRDGVLAQLWGCGNVAAADRDQWWRRRAVLDARAIATYRKRAAELAELVEQAEARGDVRRAETAQSESSAAAFAGPAPLQSAPGSPHSAASARRSRRSARSSPSSPPHSPVMIDNRDGTVIAP